MHYVRDNAVMKLSGDFDCWTLSCFLATAAAELERRAKRLVINLDSVGEIDSSALAELVHIARPLTS